MRESVKNILLAVVTLTTCVQSAKILGVYPAPAPSHNAIGARLMKELAARGHEVTFISPFPQKTPIKNFRDIALTGFIEEMQKLFHNQNMFDMMNMSPFLTPLFTGMLSETFIHKTFTQESVQQLLRSNATFDLIIKEQFHDDSLLGLAHHYKAPVLILTTTGPSIWANRLVGNPAPPSYVPDLFVGYPSKMTFLQRVGNTIMMMLQELAHFYFIRVQNNILHTYFPSAPHINDLIHNISFILLNSHVSFDPAIPSVPNMVQVGGFHVEPPKKLPQDLQNFLDDAKEGVVYFSMGSNLKSKELPPVKRDAILKVFSRLKMKVLWKWEDDTLPGQPANVKIQKWFPQQDILAHPNVKVFITHGGLLSTIEAVYHGVPVVGIPIFGDQMNNMENAVRSGYGIVVPFKGLSEDTLGDALDKIIHDPSYGEHAKEKSRLLHDQPIKPLDTAVYWVEYVIRHKGAPHLRSAALDLSWYQYLLLDVIAFLALIVISSSFLIYLGCRKVICKRRHAKLKRN